MGKEIRLQELELGVKEFALKSGAHPNFSPILTPSPGPPAPPVLNDSEEVVETISSFALTKPVALVLSFRETEVDMYF